MVVTKNNSSQMICINANCSIIKRTRSEKLKGENCIFLSKMCKSLNDHRVSHFSSESLPNLSKNYLSEDFFFSAPHYDLQ